MRHLQVLVVLLIASLAIFYNLEQFAASLEVPGVDQRMFANALVTLAVLTILVTPSIKRWIVFLVVIAGSILYFSVRLLTLQQAPSFDALHLYVTVTDLAFLVSFSVLAHMVSKSLADFKESVALITLDGAGERLPSVEESQANIQAEITRSRHFQRPLSVIAIEPDGASLETCKERLVAKVQAQLAGRYAQFVMANEVRKALRLIDLVLETKSDGSLLVLCPEADQTGATALTERVRMALKTANVQARCASATFPDEGVTFEALVSKAQSRLHHPSGYSTVHPHLFETVSKNGRL